MNSMDNLEVPLPTNKKDNQVWNVGSHKLKNTHSAHETTPEVEVASYFSVGT